MFNERVNLHDFNQKSSPFFHHNKEVYPATPQTDSPADLKEPLDLRLRSMSRQIVHPEYKHSSHVDDAIASERSSSSKPFQSASGDMRELTHMIAIYN